MLILGIYLHFRSVGVEVVTSLDAFATPAVEPLSYTNTDGKTESLLDITPAPWPSEAKSIYRLALAGIPVRISLQVGTQHRNFVIDRVNPEGHLVVVSETKADAQSILNLLGDKLTGQRVGRTE
jgi:hypothetical protein